ncbi:hypothetical protein DCCM_2069 [Desulfocucumis palustris]|uniref:Uncharacterized protein n=1 Tax=Desulfocucumis palustris TaxID=1898651 RepID=A0A2L2XA97_9FIRM|nr:hypothetical protein [Desulfocucumis palustris]GBF32972.1 hypothetical protein DCCM_2069 [Desulfocucumis palustris]
MDCLNTSAEYPPELLEKALSELKDRCREILAELKAGTRLLIEARIYGELIQLFDKHGLRTRGISLSLKIGYYNTEIRIFDCFGTELGFLTFGLGLATGC